MLIVLKNTGYITGTVIGIFLTLHPITAATKQVTPPPKPKPYQLFAKWNPAEIPLSIQNKAIADRKAAEAARLAAIEAARLAEEQRVAQEAAAKEKEAQTYQKNPPGTSPVVGAVPQSYPQSDNFYKAFIYAHESGNNPLARNAGGCLGLGQDCNGRLVAECPTLEYQCEDLYFDRYATTRYGSWQRAYEFWLQHSWW